MDDDDPRLAPILTFDRAAQLLNSAFTGRDVYRWSQHRPGRDPLVTTRGNERRGWPTVPLVGLAEAAVASHLRGLGLSAQRVANFAWFIRHQSGNRYALANPKYVTDGFTEYAEHDDEVLHELYTGQIAFRDLLVPYLHELIPWPDGTAGSYRPPRLASDLVEVDPRFNSGRMSFVRNRVPLFAIVGAVQAGDPLRETADDYGLEPDEVALVERHFDWLAEAA